MDFEDTTPEIMIYKPPHPPTNESKKIVLSGRGWIQPLFPLLHSGNLMMREKGFFLGVVDCELDGRGE